jgi:hypothetical protein
MSLHRAGATNSDANPTSVAAGRTAFPVGANAPALTDSQAMTPSSPAKVASEAMTVGNHRRRLAVESRFWNEMFGWY